MNDYHIVKIIDEKTIVINAGKKNNIKVGDEFEIYFDSENIIDPITNEDLGCYSIIKDYVQVTNVFEKISICKSYSAGTLFTTMNVFSSLVGSECKSLNVDKTDISGFGNDTTKIKVGDKVRKKIKPSSTNKSTDN